MGRSAKVVSARAEKLGSSYPITLTGVRPGEEIEGWRGQAEGTVMVVLGSVPASSSEVAEALATPNFLQGLGALPAFADMTLDERRARVSDTREGDFYLEDVAKLKVRFIAVGKYLLETLSAEALELISSGEELLLSEVVKLFPAKPGSSGLKGRHTLLFRRGIWRLRAPTSSFRGRCLRRGRLVADAEGHDVGLEYGVVTSTDRASIAEAREMAVEVLATAGLEVGVDEIVEVEGLLTWMTPAGYKSALQKLARFGASLTIVRKPCGEPQSYDSRLILAGVWLGLNFSAGSFVPDLQRFVTGVEGAFKRLVVTIFEDSWIPPSDYPALAEVASVGIVAQRIPGYRPGIRELSVGLDLLLKALVADKAWVFSCAKPGKVVLSTKPTGLELAGWLVEKTGSFESDVAMITDILSHPTATTPIGERPESVVLEHVIDQHWAPEIVYHLGLSGCVPSADRPGDGTRPFGPTVVAIFSRVTGVNPRRPGRDGRTMKPITYRPDFEDDAFTRAVRMAQRRIYVLRMTEGIAPPAPPPPGSGRKVAVGLPKSYLAGMVGAIKLPGKPPAMGTIDPSLERLVVIRLPSRDSDGVLTPEREEEALEALAKILERGVPASGGFPPPIEALARATFYLVRSGPSPSGVGPSGAEGSLRWEVSSPAIDRCAWEDVIGGDIVVPYCPVGGWYGVAISADSTFRDFLSKVSVSEIRRTLYYLENPDSRFEVTRLSREGGGTVLVPVVEDVGAFRVLWEITRLYPSALVPLDSKTFRVVSPCVLQIPLAIIRASVETEAEAEDGGYQVFENPRKMWPHQVSALEELLASPGDRKFLWIPVGMGKTQIVMEYLRRLWLEGRLPRRIIYTLPASAMASVRAEIEMFGLEVEVLSGKGRPVARATAKTEVPSGVVLVEHDHLRLLEHSLLEVASESWLVIDEVHKCLAETKRTSVALRLSSATKGFIALTGTPVIDANTYRLIWWLKKVNDFPVTEKNFWVAANAMVARKVNTGVRVVYRDQAVDLGELSVAYRALVPPSLGGQAKSFGPREFKKAMDLSLSAVTGVMVEAIVEALDDGVFVVAANATHAEEIAQGLYHLGVAEEEVFIVGTPGPKGPSSIFLTDTSGPSKVKVVITTVRHSTGYSLTRLGKMFTSVYPSNQATREQLEGRINRIGQRRKSIEIRTYHAGVLSYIHQNHLDAANFSEALRSLAVGV